ncbi:pirin family protein [Nocardioides bruguierae]|uniref:pirin family protein n=1 Tax=Nocardioides bruguierae TaxID=2945102 RepID=UPI0020214F3B|nr:pirin family protein [Nocardioides bruguierae]MCL8024558.1 pirin family protein [Nocardioides bruguierae]
MTNPDPHPDEVDCAAGPHPDALEVLAPREVPLGGPRAMTVRRTLPQRGRTLVGAWCFCDHYGPDDVAETGGMVVAPHPHTGLATVSWLFTGEIEHRDSVGTHALVRPGELNLMTAGRGISHSEVSTAATTVLHGAQLWLALPEDARHGEPRFEHHVPDPVAGEGWEARVFLGSLLGSSSPVPTATPLLGAELRLAPGVGLDLPLDPTFEHALLLDAGSLTVAEGPLAPGELGYLAPGRASARLEAGGEGARLLVLGGEPFGEAIVMFWNFVGRSHEEVAAYRADWQGQVAGDGDAAAADAGRVVADSQDVAPGRFGTVEGDHRRPLPSPALPGTRLRERH